MTEQLDNPLWAAPLECQNFFQDYRIALFYLFEVSMTGGEWLECSRHGTIPWYAATEARSELVPRCCHRGLCRAAFLVRRLSRALPLCCAAFLLRCLFAALLSNWRATLHAEPLLVRKLGTAQTVGYCFGLVYYTVRQVWIPLHQLLLLLLL